MILLKPRPIRVILFAGLTPTVRKSLTYYLYAPVSVSALRQTATMMPRRVRFLFSPLLGNIAARMRLLAPEKSEDDSQFPANRTCISRLRSYFGGFAAPQWLRALRKLVC